MGHGLPEWVDLDRRLAGLQELPIVLKFCAMNLGPRLDQPLWRPRQEAAKALERVYRVDSGVFLIERMEMRAVVLAASFDKHPDDDPEESRDLRHESSLHRRALLPG
jgi:hypothetical protein